MSVSSGISKLLIANRGEIACRVMKTAKRLGIKTVAVYSDADVNSMHVMMADEAFNIGKPPAQESYLRGDKIIEVAKRVGALAIHPGYGFLSENAEFADLCKQSEIIFVGPPASAIRDMGIKSTSKNIMSNAGVPVIPGYHGTEQSENKLKEEAQAMGYPLMIKAVRGGGGKGMRIVKSESEFLTQLESAKRESLKSFNDQAVLLERYVSRPRHIEVQIFGDQHGNYVYLFERDCSVQRRHQKVIEQAPAPGVNAELRKKLGEAGVLAAKAVNYVGAGTVEFIFDTDNKEFYFMEMNTRLQVEHPVTEMVTGVDLVEWQLRVANGEILPVKQNEIKLGGHSVEARIYAEDVLKGFMPTAGNLQLLSVPDDDNIRVETGVREGDEVSVHYDPMIAKLVVWDEDISCAFNKMEDSLAKFNVVGVENNVDFLRKLCKNKDLINGNVHTGFIDEHENILLKSQKPDENIILQAVIGVICNNNLNAMRQQLASNDPFNPFAFSTGFRVNMDNEVTVKVQHEDQVFKSNVIIEDEGSYCVRINDGQPKKLKGQMTSINGFLYVTVESNDSINKSKISLIDNQIKIFDKSGEYQLNLLSEYDSGSEDDTGEKSLQAVSPMPGVVEKVYVKIGESVKKGDPLAVVMAMKMEHIIRAERDGTIESVLFSPGDNIGKNVALVKFHQEIKKVV